MARLTTEDAECVSIAEGRAQRVVIFLCGFPNPIPEDNTKSRCFGVVSPFYGSSLPK